MSCLVDRYGMLLQNMPFPVVSPSEASNAMPTSIRRAKIYLSSSYHFRMNIVHVSNQILPSPKAFFVIFTCYDWALVWSGIYQSNMATVCCQLAISISRKMRSVLQLVSF